MKLVALQIHKLFMKMLSSLGYSHLS